MQYVHKQLRNDISGMVQNVESHDTTIMQFKQQFGQVSSILNQHQQGKCLVNTIQNQKINGDFLVITTRASKMTTDTSMSVVIKIQVELMIVNNEKVVEFKILRY